MSHYLYGQDMTKNCICTGKGAFFLRPMGEDELCPRCDWKEIEERARAKKSAESRAKKSAESRAKKSAESQEDTG